ncbi:MAG: hypothetical protein ACKOOH_00435, partial [Cyanobium sp.]
MGRTPFVCTALLFAASGLGVGPLAGQASSAAPPASQPAASPSPQTPSAGELPSPSPVAVPTAPTAEPAPPLPLLPRQVLPLAPKVLGPRPKSNPNVL